MDTPLGQEDRARSTQSNFSGNGPMHTEKNVSPSDFGRVFGNQKTFAIRHPGVQITELYK